MCGTSLATVAVVRRIGGAYQIAVFVIVVEDGTACLVVSCPFPKVELSYRTTRHQALHVSGGITSQIRVAIVFVIY